MLSPRPDVSPFFRRHSSCFGKRGQKKCQCKYLKSGGYADGYPRTETCRRREGKANIFRPRPTMKPTTAGPTKAPAPVRTVRNGHSCRANRWCKSKYVPPFRCENWEYLGVTPLTWLHFPALPPARVASGRPDRAGCASAPPTSTGSTTAVRAGGCARPERPGER